MSKQKKDFKKRRLEIEQYLEEVRQCEKAGGEAMESKLKVRAAMKKKDKEKKAAAKKPKAAKGK